MAITPDTCPYVLLNMQCGAAAAMEDITWRAVVSS
jgi:hypothetical protein